MTTENPDTKTNPISLLIITGMSGSGKSKTVNTLEDIGYFCVDNLPPALFGKFIEGLGLREVSFTKIAVVADIRSGEESLPELENVLADLKADGVEYQLLFLEASANALVRRYKENRRPHPLAHGKKSVSDCIEEEKSLLQGLRGRADIIIDTTENYNDGLVDFLIEKFSQEDERGISVYITSFGFKYGMPIDADIVMDVRFLPNPYYIPEMKEKTGQTREVADFVLKNEVTREFLRNFMRMIRFLLPHYQKEGKKNIIIALGCTGGRHRSVALSEKVGKNLAHSGYKTFVKHRDVQRGGGKVKS